MGSYRLAMIGMSQCVTDLGHGLQSLKFDEIVPIPGSNKTKMGRVFRLSVSDHASMCIFGTPVVAPWDTGDFHSYSAG